MQGAFNRAIPYGFPGAALALNALLPDGPNRCEERSITFSQFAPPLSNARGCAHARIWFFSLGRKAGSPIPSRARVSFFNLLSGSGVGDGHLDSPFPCPSIDPDEHGVDMLDATLNREGIKGGIERPVDVDPPILR